MEVEVISKETIKPSSPTPDNLRHQQLSFLDQIQPPVYMPLVLFYPKVEGANFSKVQQCDKIKKSLSEALTLFYPLAGRVKGNLYIDCNDEGVHYREAEAKFGKSYKGKSIGMSGSLRPLVLLRISYLKEQKKVLRESRVLMNDYHTNVEDHGRMT
ncbi:vinorine synthase [Quercus suber]|uniref:Vinorine synthase n=1 Tax=Quercus suber TaxID=58331 RepID=A0AAW0K038_QUESU